MEREFKNEIKLRRYEQYVFKLSEEFRVEAEQQKISMVDYFIFIYVLTLISC